MGQVFSSICQMEEKEILAETHGTRKREFKEVPSISEKMKGNTNGKHQTRETKEKKRLALLGNNRTGKPVKLIKPNGEVEIIKSVKKLAEMFEVTPKVIRI